MITVLLLGMGLGVGLWSLSVWLFPPRPALGEVLARATRPVAPPPILATDAEGWAARLGRPFVSPLRALGLPSARLRRDLAVFGRPISTHLAEKATVALIGLLLPVAVQLVLALGGVWLGLEVPVIAGLVLAGLGFLLPDLRSRSEAAKLRTGFRHALSAYLDLVWITLAGGAGVDSALGDSVAVGRGWAFAQIRRALSTARLTRTTPWATLRQLGDELDVTELSELAASVSLAGTEGAKVRASLAAKAAALRTHQITDAEAEAQAATERMSLPVVALFLGFLVFIGYPALTQVLNGL
ncbi:type II secretion system F family protein [Saccharopolyspora phatthalungensis]|uniref:Flp pilus assembly protein TadB n=1 Tax=Saccharopolyspora phatthalungensis TaxID=664693 RepID=A0A840Q9L8_9PSEU|nr:type II secretion system F family protein [Saccharopolyspora phatthalungensis]MBB5157464.1 Flp pilus assembly protein TadB [Saccharopolyspora phatthalungensis]